MCAVCVIATDGITSLIHSVVGQKGKGNDPNDNIRQSANTDTAMLEILDFQMLGVSGAEEENGDNEELRTGQQMRNVRDMRNAVRKILRSAVRLCEVITWK